MERDDIVVVALWRCGSCRPRVLDTYGGCSPPTKAPSVCRTERREATLPRPALPRPQHYHPRILTHLARRAHELDDATRALEREFVQELRDLEVCERGRGPAWCFVLYRWIGTASDDAPRTFRWYVGGVGLQDSRPSCTRGRQSVGRTRAGEWPVAAKGRERWLTDHASVPNTKRVATQEATDGFPPKPRRSARVGGRARKRP